MIAIIGSEGSMGKRYQAILNYLCEPFVALDRLKHHEESILEQAKACDRIIIATPTHTHVSYLRELLPTKKPILCEKPITKNVQELEELHAWCARSGYSYHMVYQYKEILPTYAQNESGPSSYNYFRHGNDGLAWDCLQIIGLANGPITLHEDSPAWRCFINGYMLRLSNMDCAYVDMIGKWLGSNLDQTMDEILHVHRKVQSYIESQASESN